MTSTNREKLVARIQKLLSLASSNSSAAEAESALLHARKLMAEHGVTESDVEDEQDNVDREDAFSSGRLNDLKVHMLGVIAVHHRCRTMTVRSYKTGQGVSIVQLVGYDRDRSLAKALFDWAWRVVSEQADTYVKDFRKKHRHLDRSEVIVVRRSYVLGFVHGLKQAYTDQIVANPEWALVLATPAAVNDLVEEVTEGRVAKSKRSAVYSDCYDAGIKAGADHVAATSHKDTPVLPDMPKMLIA